MKINYQDKEFINADLSTPNKNKVTDLDMNEIKNVVNTNADTLDDTTERMTTLEQDASTRIGNMEQSIVDFGNDITEIQDDIDNIEDDIQTILNETYTKSEVYNKEETDNLVNNAVGTVSNDLQIEERARQSADVNLQNQIDSIVASSDVVDIVGTYQELQNYDTSKLGDNDIIKVLDDSTHNNATSYFRWKKSTSTWQYIGSEGPYYTKSETNELLNGKVNKETGKGLSTNDFTNTDKTKLNGIESNAQVNKLESVKVNGSTQTITNKSVDISVPTKTTDLQNNSGFITKDVNDLTNYYKKTETYTQAETNTLLNAKENTSNKVTSLSSSSTDTQYPSAKCVYDLIGDIDTALDLINGEVVS